MYPDERPTKLGGPAPYYAIQKRIGTLDKSINLRGCRVLDLGCGNGCYTSELARRSDWICGADFQISNLYEFREGIQRVQCVGENLPFADGSFDAVTMIEVLEHTANDEAVARECWRVLSTQGALILFVPNKLYPLESHPCYLGSKCIGRNIPLVSWLPSKLHDKLCPARIYTKARLEKVVKPAGFELQVMGYIYPPIDNFRLPLKGLYRKVSWWLEKSPMRVFGVSIFAVFRKLNGNSPGRI
jgi:ubiquinone/menaquinone biosynthesis C-methylase UbiE